MTALMTESPKSLTITKHHNAIMRIAGWVAILFAIYRLWLHVDFHLDYSPKTIGDFLFLALWFGIWLALMATGLQFIINKVVVIVEADKIRSISGPSILKGFRSVTETVLMADVQSIAVIKLKQRNRLYPFFYSVDVNRRSGDRMELVSFDDESDATVVLTRIQKWRSQNAGTTSS